MYAILASFPARSHFSSFPQDPLLNELVIWNPASGSTFEEMQRRPSLSHSTHIAPSIPPTGAQIKSLSKDWKVQHPLAAWPYNKLNTDLEIASFWETRSCINSLTVYTDSTLFSGMPLSTGQTSAITGVIIVYTCSLDHVADTLSYPPVHTLVNGWHLATTMDPTSN